MADESETHYCSNCKRQIAAANFIMHEVHCRRNIVLCEQCQEPVPRSEMDAHIDEYHALVPCPECLQKFEKSLLDDHKPECPKRKQHCDYCELDMPACDLPQHKEYCGTRTQPCPLCSQFIMFRDWEQHELTVCAYPPMKRPSPERSVPANSGAAHDAPPFGINNELEEFDPGVMNPFAMNELSRILNEPSLAQPVPNNTTATATGASSRQTQASGSRRHIKPRRPLHINRNISRTKNTNESIQSQRANNIDNRQTQKQQQSRMRNKPQNNPADLDEILARHLAQDLEQDPFADGAFPDLDRSLIRQPVQRSPSPPVEQDSEEVSLPCEFCDELFPIEFLFEHQNSCNSGSSIPERNVSEPIDISPGLSPSDMYEDVLPNNSPQRNITSNSQPPRPQIVDNLSMLAAQDWFSSPAAASGDMDGETMLPCEFCSQLFPDDLLVQHQAVCDVEWGTPPQHQAVGNIGYRESPGRRSPTPGSTNSRLSNISRSSRTRSNGIGASGAESTSTTRSRASRRQGDPTFDFESDRRAMDDAVQPTVVSTRGRSGPTGRRGVNRTFTNRSRASAFNEPSTNSTQARRGTNTTKPMNKASPASREPIPGSLVRDSVSTRVGRKSSPEQRRRGSAARTNRTLEQLLKDPHSSTDELLAAMDKEEKSNRNQRTKEATNGNTQDPDDLSLSGAISGTKPWRTGQRYSDECDGISGYDPSFAAASRPAPRVSSKPRPVVPHTADYAGASNLRLGNSRSTSTTASRGIESSGRTVNNASSTRKRTSSRPRNAPQGEP